ncbi:MAG: type II toxin-antitoxin system prevent-host-death family antitoxin [Chloroflexi bacterium]|nr:type II toxin-antitoxin system prevent-host-death family antitoxin [Chloroflexota bacterium]
MHEAKSQLSRLVARAEAGEEILIARNGKPAVKLVSAASSPPSRRVGGSMRGQIQISSDFDAPEDDFEPLFYEDGEPPRSPA